MPFLRRAARTDRTHVAARCQTLTAVSEHLRAYALRRTVRDGRASPDASLTLVNVVTYGRAVRMPIAIGSYNSGCDAGAVEHASSFSSAMVLKTN
jgi:hypothetical protein